MSHVQLIKKRFEELNLNSEIASLVDCVPLRTKSEGQSNLFKRSATLIEFSSSNFRNNNNNDNNNNPENNHQRDESSNFQRQHSSDNAYKSLRRSQAFRLDLQQKPNFIPKKSPSTNKLKRQNAIKVSSPTSDKKPQFDEVEYLERSETIKKALIKPLPAGPAPKKPPRTFAASPRTSPLNENNNFVDDLEKTTEFNNQADNLNNIDIKVNSFETRNSTLPKSMDRKIDKKGISSFLNCIVSPCSIDPIYYEQIKQERRQLVPDEKIYMEPFEHLNHMKNVQDNSSANNKTEELHYLCTNLIDQTNNNSSPFDHKDISRSFLDCNIKESPDIESYEKINILMDVVYDENHRDNIMEESSGSSEIESRSPVPKVTRSLTEKRKKYVRRVTECAISKETISSIQQQSASSIITQFQRIIDSNTGEPSKQKKTESNSLFKMLFLAGYDMMNKTGYIKSIYPKTEKALPMLEQFIYPNKKYASELMTKENQNFTLILTDEYGNNLFGYCRQIIAEGFEEKCLPLTYCIISKVNASGFYFSLLKEIESRHGYPEVQFSNMMRSLYNQELPENGKILHVKLFDSSTRLKKSDQKSPLNRNVAKRLSLESPDWLKAEASSLLQNRQNDTNPIARSQTESIKRNDEIIIKRTEDVRLQNVELTVLHESTTKELLIMIFGTLLIERKVIILGNNISQITSCVSALYSILYPFQWHHTIIALIPDQIIELLQAPFPFFAGVLKNSINVNTLEIEDGIVVDLETKTLIRKCGDESTLVPETLKKSLLLSLKIADAIDKGEKIKNVLVAEAFLQYFVKIFCKLDPKTYSKNKFIESQSDQATKFFLEWFLDTIMFKEFLSKKQNDDIKRENGQSSENYFELFNLKILGKSATLSDNQQRKNIEMLMKHSSNKKKRNFKDKIKDFLKS